MYQAVIEPKPTCQPAIFLPCVKPAGMPMDYVNPDVHPLANFKIMIS